MCICYSCGNKGHLSHTCLKPWKQQIQLTKATKVDLKSFPAKAVVATMDVRDMAKRTEQAKGPRMIFMQVNSETHTPFNQ